MVLIGLSNLLGCKDKLEVVIECNEKRMTMQKEKFENILIYPAGCTFMPKWYHFTQKL
jgi:hypothetical protein